MSFFWDEITKEKFIILYFFKRSLLELTNNQIVTVMLQNEWCDYFTLQQSLEFLCETGLLAQINRPAGSCYCISSAGEHLVAEFGSRLPQSLKDEIDVYIENNKARLQLTCQNLATFEKSINDDYIVKCSIIEGSKPLLELKLNVPSRNIAAELAKKWQSKGQDAYTQLLSLLS